MIRENGKYVRESRSEWGRKRRGKERIRENGKCVRESRSEWGKEKAWEGEI